MRVSHSQKSRLDSRIFTIAVNSHSHGPPTSSNSHLVFLRVLQGHRKRNQLALALEVQSLFQCQPNDKGV